jgi:hypothetical protein
MSLRILWIWRADWGRETPYRGFTRMSADQDRMPREAFVLRRYILK